MVNLWGMTIIHIRVHSQVNCLRTFGYLKKVLDNGQGLNTTLLTSGVSGLGAGPDTGETAFMVGGGWISASLSTGVLRGGVKELKSASWFAADCICWRREALASLKMPLGPP